MEAHRTVSTTGDQAIQKSIQQHVPEVATAGFLNGVLSVLRGLTEAGKGGDPRKN
jgi:hypothetical protein